MMAQYYDVILHDEPRALAECDSGLARSPRNPALLNEVMTVAEADGRWDQAEIVGRQLSVLDPRRSPVQVQHAVGHADLRTTMSYYRFVRDLLLPLVSDTAAVSVALGATLGPDVPTSVPKLVRTPSTGIA